MAALKVGAGVLLSISLASAQFGWLHGGKAHPPKITNPAKITNPDEGGFLGVVTARNSDSFVMLDVDTRIITFKLADTTLYFHGSKWAHSSLLKRGVVVKVDASADKNGVLTAENVAFQEATPEFQRHAKATDLLPGGVTDDPLVQRAREATQQFFRMLPNFVCQQSTTRSYGDADKHWLPVDQITAEVVYDHHHESYRDIKLNGRPTGRSMMDLPGSRSTGEFGSTLRALFDPNTAALFKFHGTAMLGGFSAASYDFAVSGDQSDWLISAGSQKIRTSYTGRIWIDRKSGNVVRLEMKAVDLPKAFPFQAVDAEVDYGPVILPSGRYFLPERAENISCNDPKACSRNLIQFRNYHKYIGESSISFDAPDVPDVPDPNQ